MAIHHHSPFLLIINYNYIATTPFQPIQPRRMTSKFTAAPPKTADQRAREWVLATFPRIDLYSLSDYQKACVAIAIPMVDVSMRVLTAPDWRDAKRDEWLSKEMVPVWARLAFGDPIMAVLLSKLPHYSAKASGIPDEELESARKDVVSGNMLPGNKIWGENVPPQLEYTVQKQHCDYFMDVVETMVRLNVYQPITDDVLMAALAMKAYVAGAQTLLRGAFDMPMCNAGPFGWLHNSIRPSMCSFFGAVDWITKSDVNNTYLLH